MQTTDDSNSPDHAMVLAKLLTEAGWNGRARDGWLFHAHATAEGDGSPSDVAADLGRRLELAATPSLDAAAASVHQFARSQGPFARTDIDVLESTVSWRVRHPTQNT